MDVFKEQLLKIKKSPAEYALMAVIFIVAVVVSVILFLMSGQYPLFILFIVAVFYGTGKLLSMFSIEYEYIVTNTVIDVDKIMSKSTRKRIISFEGKDILRTERVGATPPVTDATEKFVCCNKDDSNAYWVLISKNGKKSLIMMAPNEKMVEAIKLGSPKMTAKEIFN
ncbi:MAG: hypothetical protein IJF35_00555 [Clostridia bacterium]|nr:hypothetical protein [Clostridia bacterium]